MSEPRDGSQVCTQCKIRNTNHKSGQCLPCRQRSCADCGKTTRNQDPSGVYRCSNCRTRRFQPWLPSPRRPGPEPGVHPVDSADGSQLGVAGSPCSNIIEWCRRRFETGRFTPGTAPRLPAKVDYRTVVGRVCVQCL